MRREIIHVADTGPPGRTYTNLLSRVRTALDTVYAGATVIERTDTVTTIFHLDGRRTRITGECATVHIVLEYPDA
ncbi:hypothetical protein HY480_02615 [Candidatus Uhrbacteria bacterium]|nr:hypothetical protein [Candidatus Uhrbacteria bacterium]